MFEILQIIWLVVLGLQISIFGGYYAYMRRVCASHKEESLVVTNENTNAMPSVTFFIPTYNEEANIIEKLANTFELAYPQEKMRVFIVDDASTDKTVPLIEEFKSLHPEFKIELIRKKERRGKIDSWDIIIDMKKDTDLVCESDADVICHKESLLEVVKRFKDPKIGAACGIETWRSEDLGNVTREMERTYRSLYITLRVGESLLHSTPLFEAGLMAVRSGLLEKTESSSGADDAILAFGAVKAGYRAVEEPKSLFSVRSHQETFVAKFKEKSRRGNHMARVFIENSSMLFKRKYGRFGTLILPIETYMHVVSPFLCFLLIALLPFVFFNIITVLILACLTSLLIFPKSRITLLSFLSFQIALAIGLFSLAAGKKHLLY